MTDTLIPPTNPDALAKLAEIPAVGSEERDFWLMAAERHGLLEPAADDENWVGAEADILRLMSEARKQGQRDVLASAPTPVADGGNAPDPHPQSPTRPTLSEDGMTVEEARDFLERLDGDYFAEEQVESLRLYAQRWSRPRKDQILARADRIELALRTLQDNGEVR